MSVLSGGEKSRLALARILRESAESAADGRAHDAPRHPVDRRADRRAQAYEGTLIFISHDVHFIRALAQNGPPRAQRTAHALRRQLRLLPRKVQVDRRARGAHRRVHRRATRASQERRPRPLPRTRICGRQRQRQRQKTERRTKFANSANTSANSRKASSNSKPNKRKSPRALEAPETYADKGKFHHLNRELSTIVDQINTATTEWEEAATRADGDGKIGCRENAIVRPATFIGSRQSTAAPRPAYPQSRTPAPATRAPRAEKPVHSREPGKVNHRRRRVRQS